MICCHLDVCMLGAFQDSVTGDPGQLTARSLTVPAHDLWWRSLGARPGTSTSLACDAPVSDGYREPACQGRRQRNSARLMPPSRSAAVSRSVRPQLWNSARCSTAACVSHPSLEITGRDGSSATCGYGTPRTRLPASGCSARPPASTGPTGFRGVPGQCPPVPTFGSAWSPSTPA